MWLAVCRISLCETVSARDVTADCPIVTATICRSSSSKQGSGKRACILDLLFSDFKLHTSRFHQSGGSDHTERSFCVIRSHWYLSQAARQWTNRRDFKRSGHLSMHNFSTALADGKDRAYKTTSSLAAMVVLTAARSRRRF
jgi:hypothetical protein